MKKGPVRDGRAPNKSSKEALIDSAKNTSKYGVRSDPYAEGVGYLGVDDLDRLRRRKIK